ncbi:Protein ASP-7 [Aphelenchoides avenae]|nr:Protein ASP-7 [Aphelenchus avenae]
MRSATIRYGKQDSIPVDSSINSNVTRRSSRSCESADWDDFGDAIHVTDDIRLGASRAPLKKIPFVVVTKIRATLDPHWHSDGVLGLMRNGGGYLKNLSTIHQLANELGSPEISLFWKKNVRQGEQAGAITIGGRDAKNCDTKWSLFVPPKKSLINWELSASSWSVGSRSFGETLIEFETAESGLALLPMAYLEIVLLTNAKYDAANGYTVDCSKISQFPPVNFVLPSDDGSSFKLSVPAEDYVVKQDNGKCALNITWDPDSITIGTSVKSYCWLMHYGKEMFCLAKALQ